MPYMMENKVDPSPRVQSPKSIEGIARGDFTAILDRLGVSLFLSSAPRMSCRVRGPPDFECAPEQEVHFRDDRH
jgi:hypothetical protein